MPRLSWNQISIPAHIALAPLAMPKELVDAHHTLDRAVDRLYQRKPFDSDADRVVLLFRRFQELAG